LREKEQGLLKSINSATQKGKACCDYCRHLLNEKSFKKYSSKIKECNCEGFK
jgi:hypothetical protein